MACGLQNLEHKVVQDLPGCRRSPMTVSSSCDAFDYTPVRSSPPFGKRFPGSSARASFYRGQHSVMRPADMKSPLPLPMCSCDSCCSPCLFIFCS